LTKYRSFPLALKIHLGIAVCASLICVFVWHWYSTDYKYWWWIFPCCFFAMTLSLHVFIPQRAWWKMSVALVSVANIAMFLGWALDDVYSFPWYIYPLFVSGMIMVIAYFVKYKPEKKPTMLLIEYGLLMLMLFLTWLYTMTPLLPGTTHPWWLYPLFLCALPFLNVGMKMKYGETRPYAYLAVNLIDVNVMLFFCWVFTTAAFPWFIIPWVISAGVIALVYFKLRGKYQVPQVSADGANEAIISSSQPTVIVTSSPAQPVSYGTTGPATTITTVQIGGTNV